MQLRVLLGLLETTYLDSNTHTFHWLLVQRGGIHGSGYYNGLFPIITCAVKELSICIFSNANFQHLVLDSELNEIT